MAENKGRSGEGGQGAPKAPPVERTDFESKSHQELWAMVQGMKGDSAHGLAQKLAKAATTITKIGEDLKLHMSRVVWQGEGAKAFTNWGHDAAMATLELGKYSQDASGWLASVSHAITQAKSAVPEYDPALKQQATDTQKLYIAAHHDPDGQKDAREASAKLTGLHEKMEGQRQEAVRELKRLADVYVQSGEQVAGLRPPVFPPPPAVFVPEGLDRQGMQHVQGAQTSPTGGSRTSTARTGDHRSTPSGTTHSTSVTEHTVTPVGVRPSTPVPDMPVGTEIDGVHTLPPPTHVTPVGPTATPPTQPVGRPDIGPMPPVGVIPPTFTGGGKGGVPGPGVLGGRQATGGLRGPGLPGRGTVGGLPPSALPREPGIVGGRPVPPGEGRPTSGIPRGTVVGDEGRQGLRGTQGMQGRPPMGHGPGGHVGGGGGRGGFSAGRRLAAEPGGIVGGRPTEPGTRTGRPFTEGGSGLVRNGTAEGNASAGRSGNRGMMPPGTHGPAGRRDEREGERPDYLTEDEETWQQSDRRIVPPVID
ncbi:hypothetical protein AB0M57_33955 [Streptomyces sp. NPDC051597]|uniref:hypothetical protein n=1 Tax=Streptomyces sp. NPDC051597 TaxID=3155049 RepID=UPI00342E6E39